MTAHQFPAVGLNLPLAVNNDVGVTGQSYEYTVKNQFIEVTNKWDANGTYFYLSSVAQRRRPGQFSGQEPGTDFVYLSDRGHEALPLAGWRHLLGPLLLRASSFMKSC